MTTRTIDLATLCTEVERVLGDHGLPATAFAVDIEVWRWPGRQAHVPVEVKSSIWVCGPIDQSFRDLEHLTGYLVAHAVELVVPAVVVPADA